MESLYIDPATVWLEATQFLWIHLSRSHEVEFPNPTETETSICVQVIHSGKALWRNIRKWESRIKMRQKLTKNETVLTNLKLIPQGVPESSASELVLSQN